MLNNQGARELAYVVEINSIEPIVGSDNCEAAVVGGWKVMVRKGTFQSGDLAIYFEVDSKLDTTKPEFSFLEKYHGKVKTQRYTFGGRNPGFYSQGLLMHPSDFGWEATTTGQFAGDEPIIKKHDGKYLQVGDFLTAELGVTYADEEDNKRKAKPDDKYKKMAQRNEKLFSKQPFRWLMQRKWGRKLLFLFFGKKRDKKSEWPSHIAPKTDVERIQNEIWRLTDKQPYVATEKIDGSSCSIMAERKRFGKINYYVCSRNVVFKDENQKCFYDDNIYFEIYNKYNLKEKITQILNDYHLQNVALQLEVYGAGVQKRDYSIKNHEGMVFHIVTNREKFPMDKVVEICEKYDIPHVPVIDDNYVFPDTIEELQAYVEGEPSKVDRLPKEGIVFYDKATGQQYTKFVSPSFLLKFHS